MKKPTIEIDGKKYRLTVQKMNGQPADEHIIDQIYVWRDDSDNLNRTVDYCKVKADEWQDHWTAKNKELIQFKQQAIRSAEAHLSEVAALKTAIQNSEDELKRKTVSLKSWLALFITFTVAATLYILFV